MNSVSTFQSIGLSPQSASLLVALLQKHLPAGSVVVVYGSRAKGNFTERSDLDLAIKCATPIDAHLLDELHEDIDESNFPYLCDIQQFETIGNPVLVEHIERVGKILYPCDCSHP